MENLKIDRRKNYYIVIDTEACPNKKMEDNQVNPANMLVYDVGFAVVDKAGNVYNSYSFVVKEIFIDNYSKVQSAYYNDKIPQYIEDIGEGTRTIASIFDIKDLLNNLCKIYNIKEIYAHNMRFDAIALSNTMKYITNNKYGVFFDNGLQLCCTMQMFTYSHKNSKHYTQFCHENGFLTKHKKPQNRVTAEIIYRYLSNDLDFVESHTGLEDVMIEKDIMSFCWSKHISHKKRFWGN